MQTPTTLEKELQFLKKTYRDIICGYTLIKTKNENIFFKHLTELEYFESNAVYINEYTKAVNQGLLNEEDKLEILYEKDLWAKEKNTKILDLKEELISLRTTKSKLIIKSQIASIDNQIENTLKELSILEKDKEEALGLTAETVAFRKSNEYILYISMKKNENNDSLFASLDEFEDINIEKLTEYFYLYKEYADIFSIKNLKKISISPFFMNSFLLSEDNIFNFYGKPIIDLTQHQIDVYSLARGYKNSLIKINKSPPSNFKDFDELLNWYETGFILKSNDKNKDFYGKTYFGASQEELNTLKQSGTETIDLHKEAAKINDGKDLNFEQILKLHGEI